MTGTHAKTIRVLLTIPPCIDAVIKRLTDLSQGGDARTLSDLAAAYYVRAQKDDRPSDLLRSLDSANRAVAANGNSPAASYNLALAQDALGFREAAAATWVRTSTLDQSPWAAEAKGRHQEILRSKALQAASEWRVSRTRLPELAARNDREAVGNLIRAFPAAAQRYIDDELLPGWASALRGGKNAEGSRLLQEASVIAFELSRITGDPYLHEAIDRIDAAGDAELRLMIAAHEAVQRARDFERAYRVEDAAKEYRKASSSFARAGSPLRWGAELGYFTQLARREDKREGDGGLARIENATRDHYRSVHALALSNRGFVAQIQGRYLDAIDHYGAAVEVFRAMRDEENIANVHVRLAGIYRVLGHQDAALAESLLAYRSIDSLMAVGARNLLAGETATTTLELGFPQIALDYQSAFIDALRETQRTAPRDRFTTAALRVNRAIALRGRAAIRLHLGDRTAALTELREASGIAALQSDEKIGNALQARIAEVSGEAALAGGDAKRAVEAFSQAMALAGPIRYRTFQAILLARRAEAHRLAGNQIAAQDDLEAAIAEVNAEEADLLSGRARTDTRGEGLWRDYFSRFDESYGWLIRILAASKREREAFAYAEKARAFEPLKLVLDLPVDDEIVRSLDRRMVDPKSLDAIQSFLPLGTFLLEYYVTERETYVWIVSHDDFASRTLPVGKKEIESWTRALQSDATLPNRLRFEAGLTAPFEALLRKPLEAMSAMKFSDSPEHRLVIVPDRFTHGLPFAALRDARTGSFLIERSPVAVAPSATLYLHALSRDRKLRAVAGAPSSLFIGDPAFNENLELARGVRRLEHARAEAQELAAMYGDLALPLVESQATVPAFLVAAKRRAIIHIAGHAVVNRHAPFGTLLLMAPAKEHNGLLYADELLTRLQLDQARLVVLAACSSAGGAPVGPEGLAPLVRPFIAAGVPSVVGSLWPINDQQSREVLVEFHRLYRDGRDAATALQLAQIHFLKDPRRGIPATAWAAFQVVGFASSPWAVGAAVQQGESNGLHSENHLQWSDRIRAERGRETGHGLFAQCSAGTSRGRGRRSGTQGVGAGAR